MDGFYVFGGGMGHLSRVKKFISHQRINDFRIITGNSLATRFFKDDEIIFFTQKSKDIKLDLTNFLAEEVSSLSFEDFYVDCFPAGILYELRREFFDCKSINYLTRRIKKNSYQFDQVTIKYNTCIALEDLESDQLSFIESQKMYIRYISLPAPLPNSGLIPVLASKHSPPIWLIIHSSNIEEIELLILKAHQLAELESVEPKIILISDNNSESRGVYWINNEMCPINYFPLAEKIFTGAGFNIIHELKGYKNKHVCLPFERKYDDQKLRLRNFMDNT
mgnify:CR=1 FL=1